MGILVGDGGRFQAAAKNVAGGEQEFLVLPRQRNQQLLLDFHQPVFVRQFQGYQRALVAFAQQVDQVIHLQRSGWHIR